MEQTDGRRPAWRAKAAVAALAVTGLYNALIQFGVTDQFASQYPDPYQVMRLQERIGRALHRVPVEERVGYFSDVPFTEPHGQAAFFAAQYAFAPRIVVKEDAEAAWRAKFWLAVFLKQEDFTKLGQDRGLAMEQDLGGYVVLYRRLEAGR